MDGRRLVTILQGIDDFPVGHPPCPLLVPVRIAFLPIDPLDVLDPCDAAAVRFLAVYAAYDRDEWAGGPRVTCPPVDPLEAAADTFFTALVFTDVEPTVDAAHLLGRIQGRELAERERPAEGAVLNESSAG